MCLLLGFVGLSNLRGVCRGKLAMSVSRLCVHAWAFLRDKACTNTKAWVSDFGVKYRAKRAAGPLNRQPWRELCSV